MELEPHPYRVIEDQTTRDGYEVPVPTQPHQRALPTLPAHEGRVELRVINITQLKIKFLEKHAGETYE